MKSKEILISDTSALIILKKLNHLNLLNDLFDKVLITKTIKNEYKEAIPDWIKVEDFENDSSQQILELNLDPGEALLLLLPSKEKILYY